ncbi:ABC transporter substrate-binding protein [Haliovirga abyssi]|uniref:ABC transporter substrate-binding protein n=1 Tax=Haliovirga abyssi TaxID=2996794 RepID=A0AAU9DDQ2_9FUSO|nr:extracellular solute-binding protein [Haliovirga abyssi]BDU51651.1 hypothetical protein HLVA_22200 [Haliovirga abyssi]
MKAIKKNVVMVMVLMFVAGVVAQGGVFDFLFKKKAEKKVPEIRIATMFGGTDPAAKVYQAALKDFEAANNVKILDESATGDDAFKTKIENDFAAGNEADLTFYFTGGMGAPLIKSGRVVPLNDLLSADTKWGNGILDSVKEQVKEPNGNIYAIPVTGFYEGLMVNTQLFEKYNLELPTDWDKFIKAVKVLKENGEVPLAIGLGKTPHYAIEYFILKAAGAKGHDSGLVNGINNFWVQGLDEIKTLYAMGAFPKDSLTTGWEAAQNLYKQGKAGMTIEGSWFVGGLPDQDHTKVLPVPAIPGTKGVNSDIIAGFTSGYYLSKRAYNDPNKKDIVLKLLKYLTTPAMIKKMATANGGVPAANVKIEGLSPAKASGNAMVAKAEHMSLPIDAQISRPAFMEIVRGVPYISVGRKDSRAVLETARNVELEAKGK